MITRKELIIVIEYTISRRIPAKYYMVRYYVMLFNYEQAAHSQGVYVHYYTHPAAQAVKKFYSKAEAMGYAKYLNRTRVNHADESFGVKVVEEHF